MISVHGCPTRPIDLKTQIHTVSIRSFLQQYHHKSQVKSISWVALNNEQAASHWALKDSGRGNKYSCPIV